MARPDGVVDVTDEMPALMSASDASSSLDDLSDRNSPSSVMEIDSANWQGPDLRAGAHFFPDGKTRAY